MSAQHEGAVPGDPASPRSPGLVERLRALHLDMVGAVLAGGDGLARVAALAAREAGAPVAVVVPRLGACAVGGGEDVDVAALRAYVTERLRGRPAPVPPDVAHEVPITSGDEVVGAVLLLGESADPDASEFLHLAAMASLTELAVAEARDEVEENLRGSFLEELTRADELDGRDVVRRAARLGCDLSGGAVALCAEPATDRPRHIAAIISGEHPGALAQLGEDGRIHALLPGDVDSARRVAERLRDHGPVGLSSFYADPADAGRALQEAELVLDVVRRSGVPITEDIGTGTYRLLFRVLASHPEEVASFYEDTIAPLVAYDEQYGSDLVGTLEAYLEHNCSTTAAATAIFVHRHTIGYRLERIRELTGLDPAATEDRERLGLGLKAYRIIAPRLHK